MGVATSKKFVIPAERESAESDRNSEEPRVTKVNTGEEKQT